MFANFNRPSQTMNKFYKIRRNRVVIQNITNNIMCFTLLRPYIKYMYSITSSWTYGVQEHQIFTEIGIATIKGSKMGSIF